MPNSREREERMAPPKKYKKPDESPSTLAGWSEVIRSSGERSRRTEARRKAEEEAEDRRRWVDVGDLYAKYSDGHVYVDRSIDGTGDAEVRLLYFQNDQDKVGTTILLTPRKARDLARFLIQAAKNRA
jgi:hypothetical protein